MTDAPEEQTINPEVGSLERLGIPLETTFPENHLTVSAAENARFRKAQPAGYAYPDVESFIFDYVIPALKYAHQKIYERDLDVHKLGAELDRVEIDLLNLQATVEQKQMNEAFGTSIEESEKDEEVTALLGTIQQLREQIASGATGGYSEEELEARVQAVREEEKRKAMQAVIAARKANSANQFTQEDVDKAVAQALAEQPASPASLTTNIDGFYTEEEVQAFVQEAVTSARAEEKMLATQNGYTAQDLQTAVAAAEQNGFQKGVESVEVPDVSNLYTQEELDQAVAEVTAVPQKDLFDDFDSEEDLGVKAELVLLKQAYKEMEKYAQELENYIEQIKPEEATPQEEIPEQRNLPPIEAKDL